MMEHSFMRCLAFFIIGLAVYLYKVFIAPVPVEIEKCPYCFGKDLCDKIEKEIVLKRSSILDLFHNYVSVKNVLYAYYNETPVVLKKLGHDYEQKKLDKLICEKNKLNYDCNITAINDMQDYWTEIIDFLTKPSNGLVKSFKVCSKNAAELFLNVVMDFCKDVDKDEYLKNIWTILQLNAEPLLLQIFNRDNESWPVPKYYGSCGRIIVESYAGSTLNDFVQLKWTQRAYLTVQLLRGAIRFTEGDKNFRYYLTDISPDNIAVDSDLNINFVDLENVVVVPKQYQNFEVLHRSENLDGNSDFSYCEDHLCKSSLSDHNYYAICKLILSDNAPFPMMEGGLLHSPPEDIQSKHTQLFENIEACASPMSDVDRFDLIYKLIDDLNKLKSYT